MSKHSIVRWIKMIGVYLLVAAVAALGWLWCVLPEEVYLEPEQPLACLLYTSPSPRDVEESRMPSSA